MFKILLADPDKNNRKKIKDYIAASKLDFRVVKEADDGKQAFEMLDKAEIDLVLCELRLPILSGYHLFKKLQYSYPNIRTIIYASYDEYQNMQKAHEEGLLDYIFKPLKQQDLEHSLVQARQVLEEQLQKSETERLVEDEYRYMLPLFKDRFLINLIHGHLENDSYIEESFKHFGVNIKSGYTAMLVKVDHYEKLNLIFDEKEKEIFIFRLMSRLQKKLNENSNGIAFINNYDELCIILGSSLSNAEAVKLGEDLRQLSRLETVTTVTIGIGRKQDKPRDISTSYRQAKAAVRHNHYIGVNSVIHIDHVEAENKITYGYPLKKEELLVYEAVNGNRQKIMKLAKELQSFLEGCGSLPDKLVTKILVDILVSVSRYATEKEINLEEVLTEHFSIRELMKKPTLKDAFSYFIGILEHICDYIERLNKESSEKLFLKAKELIVNRYAEELSLLKSAIELDVSPQYLDKLFKDKEGVCFVDFCSKYRLEIAKELLLETSMSDDEIAYKVGFRDGKYLEYAFMQSEGISTFDFRNINKSSKYLGTTKSPYV